jgi:hypothetical protein
LLKTDQLHVSEPSQLTDFLFGELDLAAFNIQRGRDHGARGFLDYHNLCNPGKKEVKTWEDLTGIIPADVRMPYQKDARIIRLNHQEIKIAASEGLA